MHATIPYSCNNFWRGDASLGETSDSSCASDRAVAAGEEAALVAASPRPITAPTVGGVSGGSDTNAAATRGDDEEGDEEAAAALFKGDIGSLHKKAMRNQLKSSCNTEKIHLISSV